MIAPGVWCLWVQLKSCHPAGLSPLTEGAYKQVLCFVCGWVCSCCDWERGDFALHCWCSFGASCCATEKTETEGKTRSITAALNVAGEDDYIPPCDFQSSSRAHIHLLNNTYMQTFLQMLLISDLGKEEVLDFVSHSSTGERSVAGYGRGCVAAEISFKVYSSSIWCLKSQTVSPGGRPA